jgi:signal transduction histidine kinase
VDWPKKLEAYRVFFEGGRVFVFSRDALLVEDLMMIKRFGEVFGFAHSRWEELKQKEAQNRRLAVEASVQRLRAEVQSMDEASDFERILSLLADSLKTVELTFDGCEIDVLDPSANSGQAQPAENPTMAHFEAKGFRYTTYSLDPGGQVAVENFALASPFPAVNRQTIERFIAGEPWQGLSDDLRIVEVPAGSYGRLRLTASGRDSFTDDEVATLREFADAVALGYARYLDIREIQEATVRKSAFLASMSHELRTPMNAIKGFTNLVLRCGKDQPWERSEENLQKVSHASDHLLTMINDLLDLSKIEAGRMDVNPEQFNVKELVATCCDTVSPLIQEGVELKQDVSDGEANTDKARVQQMVINLLSNAVKFTDSGTVTVGAEQSDGQLVVSVTDTGKGIPADELPTLFDEYRQVEGQSESSVQKGTGLGLSITKKFAELLGGSISVESELGRGSEFIVRIPNEYREPR